MYPEPNLLMNKLMGYLFNPNEFLTGLYIKKSMVLVKDEWVHNSFIDYCQTSRALLAKLHILGEKLSTNSFC